MKAGARAQLLERDITRLGTLGEFDVVLCVNDVVNYVLDRDGVRRVLSGAAANLAPGGALVFDANTLRTFRVTFATSHVRVRRGLTFRWRGRATPSFAAGDVARADLDVARGMGATRRCCATSVHLQRHHPHDELVDAIEGGWATPRARVRPVRRRPARLRPGRRPTPQGGLRRDLAI